MERARGEDGGSCILAGHSSLLRNFLAKLKECRWLPNKSRFAVRGSPGNESGSVSSAQRDGTGFNGVAVTSNTPLGNTIANPEGGRRSGSCRRRSQFVWVGLHQRTHARTTGIIIVPGTAVSLRAVSPCPVHSSTGIFV